YGLPAELASVVEDLEFPVGQPFDGRVMRGETVVINDFSAQPWLGEAIHRGLGLNALVVAPLHVWGRHFGVLAAGHRERRQGFDAQQVALVTGIARQVAVAIEAVELYRAQLDEAEVLGALAAVGRELIASLNSAEFLNRLCKVTAEVLG